MHRPVLVTASAELPVSVEDVKVALRIAEYDGNGAVLAGELDAEIESQIKAALAHYQGWNGILGISIMAQQWRQDFDAFARCLYLPVGPVAATGMSVTWRDADGVEGTVNAASYVLLIDGGGRAFVKFDRDFSFPDNLDENAAVSVSYTAGFDEVPEDLKSAIKSRVQVMIDEAAQPNSTHLERVEDVLISKYRRISI